MAKARYLILSDIHGNGQALETVLRSVRRRRYDAVLCMGDLVGYGASPNAVIGRLRRFKRFVVVRGNHDKVCAGIENGNNFNVAAKRAAAWTGRKLTKGNREFLRALPAGPLEALPGILLAHGSTTNEDAYLFSEFDALEAFQTASFRICFFGHTHYPALFRLDDQGVEFYSFAGETLEVKLQAGARYLVNPGSVGQPRDRFPWASFAEYYPDPGRLVFRRVAYDVDAAAGKIKAAGLPENLANRLYVGT